MKCVVNWISLRIRVRSRKSRPHPHQKLFEAGFGPHVPFLFDFVPLSRTKRGIWISTRKPILSHPGSILVDEFDTRWIQSGSQCGLRGGVGEGSFVACLPNTGTFVSNDHSQCHIIRCDFGADLDVGLAERSIPRRFVGTFMFRDFILWKDGL